MMMRRLFVVLFLCSVVILVVQLILAIGLRAPVEATLQSPPSRDVVQSEARKRIPPTFYESRKGCMTLAEARAAVALHPKILLDKESFMSTVERMPTSTYGIRSTDVVADIGCGSGAMEFRLLQERVEFKHLYAVDVDPSSLEFLTFALKALGDPARNRIEPRLATREDVHLPADSLDVVVVYNTHMAVIPRGPAASPAPDVRPYLRTVLKAMKPGSLLHFVIYLEPQFYASVRPTFEQAGFQTVQDRTIENGAYLIFKRPAAPASL